MSRKSAISLLLIDAGLVIAVVLTRILSASRYLHKWDSVQFALGLTDYDISRHQPHPPGYPGYIALAKIMKTFAGDDNLALVIVGVISAAVLAVAVHRLGHALLGLRGGITAGILTAFNPLLWYFSSIALAYISGVAIATLAVWASFALKGKSKWWGAVLAGISSTFWIPAGILVFPVCAWLTVRKEPAISDDEKSDEVKIDGPPVALLIAGFTALFIIPNIIGYAAVIADTGGFGPFMETIRSESGKHVIRFENWISSPLGEFTENTAQIAGFFRQGLGLANWLLLFLLIPLAGEIGLKWNKVFVAVPALIIGFAAIRLVPDPMIRTAAIILCAVCIGFLLPVPSMAENHLRRNLFIWWLVPGLLLFIAVHVNYVGILIIFLPPLILMVAWVIERFAAFMVMQTVREEHEIMVPKDCALDEKGAKPEGVKAKGPDMRVERMIAGVMIALMVIHDWGSFTNPGPKLSPIANPGAGVQENWEGILLNDKYFDEIIKAVDSCGIPLENLIILGGQYNYRHWTYYFPEAETVWTKYLLYYPVREGRGIWFSRNRVQNQVMPEIRPSIISGDVLEAVLPIDDYEGIIVFPEEWKNFLKSGEITPLLSGKGEELCFLVKPEGAKKIIFGGGVFRLE
ncbi:MAG TPA: hypothetical protein ENN67_01015 [Firmicutes bacterium]|nr:hypothetical protein [Bacillota bacterium]